MLGGAGANSRVRLDLVAAARAHPAGRPARRFAPYPAIENGEVDLEAGIAVSKPLTEKGRVKNGEPPAGKAVTCWHLGPYDRLGTTRLALAAHESEKQKARGGVWAVFWTDRAWSPIREVEDAPVRTDRVLAAVVQLTPNDWNVEATRPAGSVVVPSPCSPVRRPLRAGLFGIT